MKTLILGGIRSGKSQLAERIAATSEKAVVYIATAVAGDAAMDERIQLHQQRRPEHWTNVEEPLHLASCLRANAKEQNCELVDCLSVWVTNLLLNDNATLLTREVDALLEFLPECTSELIFVSSESSMGIIPLGELSRRYCDELGLLHQRLAEQCDRVILTIAGLPQVLKGELNESLS